MTTDQPAAAPPPENPAAAEAPPSTTAAVGTSAAKPPPANPFVPRYREPWINPAKRSAALAVGVVAAVVLLAIGVLLGAAIGRHRGGFEHRFGPGWSYRMPEGMHGPEHDGGFVAPYGRLHGHRAIPYVPPAPSTTTVTVTPTAKPAPSSSHR